MTFAAVLGFLAAWALGAMCFDAHAADEKAKTYKAAVDVAAHHGYLVPRKYSCAFCREELGAEIELLPNAYHCDSCGQWYAVQHGDHLDRLFPAERVGRRRLVARRDSSTDGAGIASAQQLLQHGA